MKEKDKEQLSIEIQHIFDSGANMIRVFNMVEAFIDKRFPTPSEPAQPMQEDGLRDRALGFLMDAKRATFDDADDEVTDRWSVFASIMSRYAASVCADKDREILHLNDQLNSARAEVERLKWEKELMLRSNTRWTKKAKQLESELAESKRRVAELEQTAPKLVLPERKEYRQLGNDLDDMHVTTWNSLLDELIRLNPHITE